MFQRRVAPDVEGLERVEALVRTRFALSSADLVLVGETDGQQPGHPPRLTTVLFWRDGARHRIAVFGPVGGVTADDLPPCWLRPALLDAGGECC